MWFILHNGITGGRWVLFRFLFFLKNRCINPTWILCVICLHTVELLVEAGRLPRFLFPLQKEALIQPEIFVWFIIYNGITGARWLPFKLFYFSLKERGSLANYQSLYLSLLSLKEGTLPDITDDIRCSLAKYLCLYLRAFFIVFLSFKERGISWIIYEIWVILANYQSFYFKDLFWSNGHYLKVG